MAMPVLLLRSSYGSRTRCLVGVPYLVDTACCGRTSSFLTDLCCEVGCTFGEVALQRLASQRG